MKYTFIGTDESLEISLKEYGVIASNELHEDGSGTHFVIYTAWRGEPEDLYGCGHISEEQIDAYMLGKEFMDDADIQSVLNFLGEELDEWFKRRFITKLHDLISYWGSDNIMGTDYNPATYDKVMENWIEPKTE